MAITPVIQGNTMELKNNSLNGGLNLVLENHYVDCDGSTASFVLTTALKQPIGFIVTQLSGTTVPLGFSSTLVPTFVGTVGSLTIDSISYKTSDDTLVVIPADVNLRIVLIGLSY
jgi:hypothetical protein